jgi:hypothetical protein
VKECCSASEMAHTRSRSPVSPVDSRSLPNTFAPVASTQASQTQASNASNGSELRRNSQKSLDTDIPSSIIHFPQRELAPLHITMVLFDSANTPQPPFRQSTGLPHDTFGAQSRSRCRQWFFRHIVRMAIYSYFGCSSLRSDDGHPL